jgi:AraC-like DNA-binding protein
LLQRAGCAWLLYPGCAALLRGGDDITVGTSITRNDPPENLDPDWPGVTGVLLGTARFGPLADEALALPDHLETRPPGAAVPSVVEAIRQVPALPQRWGRGQADALAQLVVVTLLRHNPPPVLAADNSLGGVLDVLFDPARPTVRMDDLLAVTRMSERTMRRRFLAAAGCSSTPLGRWYRSLRIRAALGDGTDEVAVATQNGYASVAAMRRALANVSPPTGHPTAHPSVV